MKYRYLLLLPLIQILTGCDGSGDRVLVAKFVYDSNISPPKRYDVVVFKYPERPIENGTPKNYIKRLLGLPGELLAIFFGRLYSFTYDGKLPEGITEEDWRKLTDKGETSDLDLWRYPQRNHETAQKLWDAGAFKILRKPPHVMLSLSRPVFDNDHQAADLAGVLPERWAAQGSAPWAADAQQGFQIAGNSSDSAWLRYRHIKRPIDWSKAKAAEIKTRKHWPQLITDLMGYNTYESIRHSTPPPNWVGDLMLECDLTVVAPKGEFWMEVNKGVDRFQARFDLATGTCSLLRDSEHKTKTIVENGQKKTVIDWQLLGTAPTNVNAAGTFHLRLANYDERLTLWVGRDLPFGDGQAYPPPAHVGPDSEPDKAVYLDDITNNDLQPAGLCSVGAAVKVHHIKLWHNTYYTGSPVEASDHGQTVNGDDWKLPAKWDSIRALRPKSIYVYPGHYLCLGDNSPESSDSRHWGLVPERLMLGRALMVYFPFDRAGDDQVTGEIRIRVRYAEADRMGFLHHSKYLVYFEQGRTELLREMGYSYRDLEDQGFLLVLTKVQCRYKSPARYDDLLTLRTTVAQTTLVKIEHRYELFRDGTVLAEAETTLGCVGRDGRVHALPEFLQKLNNPGSD